MGKHEGFRIPLHRRAAIYHGYDPRVRLLTVREAGVVLRHSIVWIRTQIRTGKMRAVKHGSAYFVTTKEVTRWMGLGARGSAPFMRLAPRRPKNATSRAGGPGSNTAQEDGTPKVQHSPGSLVSHRYEWESPIRVLVARMLGHGDAERPSFRG